MKVQNVIIFTFLLIGCTSDIDKAKSLGFTSVEQMNAFNADGYKNYEDFIKDHPYEVSSKNTKFAEAELGKPIKNYGFQENVKNYKTLNGIFLNSNINTGNISKININCSEKIKTKINASIDGINCGYSEELLKQKLGEFKEYCSTSVPYEYRHYIIKNNAYFEIHNDKKFDVELYAFGLLDSLESLNTIHEDDYIDCQEASTLIKKADAEGFSSVHEMKSALRMGFKNKAEWDNYEYYKRFSDLRDKSTNDLERALVIHASTGEDFKKYTEEGGLKNISNWRGYLVKSISIAHYNNKASLIRLNIREHIDQQYGSKLASVVNIKSSLLTECGFDWESNKSYGDNSSEYSLYYKIDNKFVTCTFFEDTKNGGMLIEIRGKFDTNN